MCPRVNLLIILTVGISGHVVTWVVRADLVESVVSEVRPVKWRHLSTGRGELPLPVAGNQQTACVVADLDGDGRQDIVVAERTKSPSLSWLRFNG